MDNNDRKERKREIEKIRLRSQKYVNASWNSSDLLLTQRHEHWIATILAGVMHTEYCVRNSYPINSDLVALICQKVKCHSLLRTFFWRTDFKEIDPIYMYYHSRVTNNCISVVNTSTWLITREGKLYDWPSYSIGVFTPRCTFRYTTCILHCMYPLLAEQVLSILSHNVTHHIWGFS